MKSKGWSGKNPKQRRLGEIGEISLPYHRRKYVSMYIYRHTYTENRLVLIYKEFESIRYYYYAAINHDISKTD